MEAAPRASTNAVALQVKVAHNAEHVNPSRLLASAANYLARLGEYRAVGAH